MIRVIGEKLKQYEKERSVEIAPRKGFNLRRVCFAKNGIWYAASVEENGEFYTAMIPDALLMATGTLTVRCDGINDEGIKAREKANFVIHRAKKPEGYIEPEIDMSSSGSGGVSSWNDLTDKPFYKEAALSNTFTCDDSTNEREVLDIGIGKFILVSDIERCNQDNLFNGTLIFNNPQLADLVTFTFADDNLLEFDDCIVFMFDNTPMLTFCFSDNTSLDFNGTTITIPKKGLWVGTSEVGAIYTFEVPTAIFKTEVIKTLDKEYLPSVAEQLTNISYTNVIEWDKDITGKESFDSNEVTTMYKVAETVPNITLEDLIGCKVTYNYKDGTTQVTEYSDSLIIDSTSVLGVPSFLIDTEVFIVLEDIENNGNTLNKGVYFTVNKSDIPLDYVSKLETVGNIFISTTYTKLPEEVLPSPDLIITFNSQPELKLDVNSYKITKGSLENVLNTIHDDRIPNVKIIYRDLEANDPYAIRVEYAASVMLSDGLIQLNWMVSKNGEVISHYMMFSGSGGLIRHGSYRCTVEALK